VVACVGDVLEARGCFLCTTLSQQAGQEVVDRNLVNVTLEARPSLGAVHHDAIAAECAGQQIDRKSVDLAGSDAARAVSAVRPAGIDAAAAGHGRYAAPATGARRQLSFGHCAPV